jgi:hypothetical protein
MAGYSSQGTLLKVGNGATPTEVFTTIAEVMDISGPEETLDTEETTSHSSPDNRKEYIGTLKDGGDISFDLNFTGDASQTVLKDNYDDRGVHNYQIFMPYLPDDVEDTINFSGIVTSLGWDIPVAGVLRRNVTIKVTGEVTYSEAA